MEAEAEAQAASHSLPIPMFLSPEFCKAYHLAMSTVMYKACMFPGLATATQLSDLLIYAEAGLARACAERPLGLTAELRVPLLQRGQQPSKDRALLGLP